MTENGSEKNVHDGGAGQTSPESTSQDLYLQALVYITGFFGHARSADSLKAGMPLEKNGMTPKVFCQAAERAGIKAKVVQKPFTDIPEQLAPVVLVLQDKSVAVLKQRQGAKAIVYFPALGEEQTLPLKELEKRYAGYAIYIKPDTDVKTGETGYEGHWFWSSLMDCKDIYGRVFLAAVLINLFGLTTPVFMMNFYDRVLPSHAVETGWVLGIGALSIFVFDLIIRSLRGYFIDVAGKKSDVVAAQRLYDQVLDMKLAARPASAGAFANILRDFDSLREFFNSATLTALVDFPFSLLFIAVIWVISPPVAAVLFGFYLIVMVASFVTQIPVRKQVAKAMRSSEMKHGLLIESLNSLETIKGVGGEGRLRTRYAHYLAESSAAGQTSRFYSGLSAHISSFFQQSSGIVIALIGMYMVAAGDMTPGGLIGCVILGSRAIAPVGMVAGLVNKYHQARASYRALDHVMQLPVERPKDMRFLHRPVLSGGYTVKDVSFSYPNTQRKVLEHISLTIKPGEKVAIAGRIGSGKSTLLKLLVNFYEPDEGSILMDNTDIRQIDPADLRRNIAYVGQDTALFSGTLRENIVLGKPDATDEEVLNAAKLSGVDDFVRLHPLGYDAPIGERGEGLSGGQRQAVAMARALLINAPILVCDEPTSAMDTQTENKMIAAMQEGRPDQTFLLVTHRGSLLKLVNRIILMDNGKIIADGPRDKVFQALADGKIEVAL